MVRVLWLVLALLPAVADAQVLAARTLRPGTVLVAADLRGPEAARTALVGQEVRRAIYAGRPVHAGDLGPPTLVRRNAIVTMVYRAGAMVLRTEGRALDAGGRGERVRVMNLDSRLSVTARVAGPGLVRVEGRR